MNKIKIIFDWFIKGLNKLITRKFKNLIFKFSIVKLTFLSLFYNDHLTQSYAIDTLLEPMFWFVDNFTKTLGPIFVFIVVLLLFIFVFIAYLIGLSFWLLKSLKITVIALFLGNYLLINALFHYFMAWKTNPGELPSNVLIKNSVSICKKCILPKPSRAHHCSICDKCILKMDHHCPWLNNCIGNFNHRYFFSFCLFVWLGTIFIMIFGVPVALNHYFYIDIFKEDFKFFFLFDYNFYRNVSNQTDLLILASDQNINDNYFSLLGINYFVFKSNCIIFEILSTISVFFGIGGLMLWHAKLITKGETCIESHINKKEKIRLESKKKVFSNPFDKGWRKNWEKFFGIDQTNITIWHIIFPSTHKPSNDGIEWNYFFENH